MSTSTAPMETAGIRRELIKCAASPFYFLDTYGRIYDSEAAAWIPFRLWPEHAETLDLIDREQLIVALKARQVGLSWLVLGRILWAMIFRPIAKPLIFSQREQDAKYLVGHERLRGMQQQLPDWVKSVMGATSRIDSTTHLALANGSVAHAFPTTAGRSYTATFVMVDEADYVQDLQAMLNAVKPTIDAGGKLVLISTSDKGVPESVFKKVYRAARLGEGGYHPIFLPWYVRPGRTQEWYESEKRKTLSRTCSLDDLHQEYPATDAEALAPRTLDKRIPPAWILQCYREQQPLGWNPQKEWRPPPIPGLEVYQIPRAGRVYAIGADPAEGNPTSDPSALTVVDAETAEEVAALAGRFEPAVFASHLHTIGRWYNNAPALVERNNHGHAVLLWLRDNSKLVRLVGHDGNPGWLSSTKGKALLYDACADAFRELETVLHSFATFTQLCSIEGATLRAPDQQHDDRADSYALAVVAATKAARAAAGRQAFRPYVVGR